jgi:fructose-specific phosphotransferase system IIC component
VLGLIGGVPTYLLSIIVGTVVSAGLVIALKSTAKAAA